MRIVICAVLYGRGGTETHLLHLCRLLAERGHEVTIACRYANRSLAALALVSCTSSC